MKIDERAFKIKRRVRVKKGNTRNDLERRSVRKAIGFWQFLHLKEGEASSPGYSAIELLD